MTARDAKALAERADIARPIPSSIEILRKVDDAPRLTIVDGVG